MNPLQFTKNLIIGGSVPRVRLYLRVMIRLRQSGHPILAKIVAARLQRMYGVFISEKAEFPNSLFLPHPVGVVIGAGVKLGEGVRIYQHVTLGGARIGDWQAGNYPEVGDSSVIFAGAVVVGKVKIGKNCIIAANSVVTKDIPDYATVAGIPARIVRQRIPEDFPDEKSDL